MLEIVKKLKKCTSYQVMLGNVHHTMFLQEVVKNMEVNVYTFWNH